jgi:queuosine precursor transporter
MIHNPADLYDHHHLKFYTPLAMLFVSLFIIVNIISQKIVPVGNFLMLTAGDFIYPINYLFSIVLTEVYGYTMSRRIIWAAFGCNILVVLVVCLAVAMPAGPHWHEQAAYAQILGRTPRILLASLSAFLIGEFIGTYILAKAKVFTHGKYLGLRTMASTLLGQLVDSIVFTTIAFTGIIDTRDVIILLGSTYGCKILYQILLTPLTYSVAGFLKKRENIDIFDRNTNFNPFNLGLK